MTHIRHKERIYSMEAFYKEIGTSRQLVWQMVKRENAEKVVEDKIVDLVCEWRKIHPQMGSRSLYYTLQNHAGIELSIGVNKFETLMRDRGLLVKRSKKWTKTSDGLGKENYPNLISGIGINGINQVIVGDITYYPLESYHAYIFTLKDAYSQRILGLLPSVTMEAGVGLQCLQNAIHIRKEVNLKGCIHHTDNGSQYNAQIYKNRLVNVGMKISRATNCLENGSAENLNGLIKNSYLKPWQISTFTQLQKACKELIHISNEQRAIHDLGYLSPVKFEELIAELPVSERPIKYLHDFENQI